MTTTKKCSKCHIDKEFSRFSKNRATKDGLQIYCKPCHVAGVLACYRKNPEAKKAQVREWAIAHKDRRREIRLKHSRKHRNLVRQLTFDHYGRICRCCGETMMFCPTIDHMDNDGAEHRKKRGSQSGLCLYDWLVRNDFPDNFQTLCRNCNWGRHRNKGICPHQEKR